MEIIAGIIGTIFGAWINNRINWQINDKIKHLDHMTEAVFNIQFYIIKSVNEQQNYKNDYLNAMSTFIKASNVLSEEVKLKQLSDYTLNSMKSYNHNKTGETRNRFEDDLSKLHICIHETRNEISSFCYMFKQLVPCKKLYQK